MDELEMRRAYTEFMFEAMESDCWSNEYTFEWFCKEKATQPTPEEKVLEYYTRIYRAYEEAWGDSPEEFRYGGMVDAIEETLDILGIKIDGVNVDD